MYKIQPKTFFFGKNTIYLPSCHSTNDFAAEMLAKSTVFDGTVIVTPNQTAGRGQRGNTWESQSGKNLTFSLIVKPNFLTAMQQFRLNVAVSVGIQQCLEPYFGNDLRIKWSNDVYVGSQKLGGVLIENTLSGYQIAQAVIGIGLNVNQENFQDSRATSFKKQLHQNFSIETLLISLLEHLEKTYLQLKNNQYYLLRTAYLSKLFRINEKHYYESNSEQFLGEIVGISEIGQLQILVENKIKEFGIKEVTFLGGVL